MSMKHGKFVISLDFELFWGVRDKRTIESYGDSIRNVHKVIPRLLEIFDEFDVKATFSTVGFLYFKDKEQLLENVPNRTPTYEKNLLDPYQYLNYDWIKGKEEFHFAPELIKLIRQTNSHEIGTHTFSHYCCLERGQVPEQFDADIKAAVETAAKWNISTKSIVFPRNQYNEIYLEICKKYGITCFRGNERSWIYKPRGSEEKSNRRRLVRLIDSYINISGHNCYSDEEMMTVYPYDIPSSRILRPYIKKLSFLEPLKLQRITNSMEYAAQNNFLFHLWWHPHNFGSHLDKNFNMLKKILQRYKKFNRLYGFRSYTMAELSEQLEKKSNG